MLIFLSSFFTEQERIEAYTNPSPMILSEEFLSKHEDEILLFMLKIGVTYPTEISRSIALNIDTINKILSSLKKKGYINRITPHHWHPALVFQNRINEFWEMGLDSYQKVTNCSWWIVTLEGIGHIKNKYNGQGRRINRGVVEYYNLSVEKESGFIEATEEADRHK